MLLAPLPPAIVLLAAVRPEGLDLPLFVHVLGAVALVGAAATAAAVAVGSRTDAADWSRRLAFRLALLATLPAYIVMRVGAEWIRVAEFGDSSSAGWIVLGYITADGGLVLLILATVLVWLSARRRSARLAATAAVLLGIAVVAWVVTAWAMTAKPF